MFGKLSDIDHQRISNKQPLELDHVQPEEVR